MFHRGEIVELYIDDYAFGGRGIAKVPVADEGHYVVFERKRKEWTSTEDSRKKRF